MAYTDVIRSIVHLPWERANPGDVVILTRTIAREFATGLRRSRAAYPTDTLLEEVAAGELETNNLNFEDYTRTGDHWEFLDFFIKKLSILPSQPALTPATATYLSTMDSFSADETIMILSSREKEAKGMYNRILRSQDWSALKLGFYEYYLQRHIELDSEEGGHAGLLAHVPVTDEVLTRAYTARLQLYASLF